MESPARMDLLRLDRGGESGTSGAHVQRGRDGRMSRQLRRKSRAGREDCQRDDDGPDPWISCHVRVSNGLNSTAFPEIRHQTSELRPQNAAL
jgi:hypothetical protein